MVEVGQDPDALFIEILPCFEHGETNGPQTLTIDLACGGVTVHGLVRQSEQVERVHDGFRIGKMISSPRDEGLSEVGGHDLDL